MAEKKKTNQIDRFTCGIYDYDAQDRVLLKVLNGRVPKHLRGNEIKKMAMIYLATQEPKLYKKLLNETLEEMSRGDGIVISNIPTIIPTEIVNIQVESRTSKALKESQQEAVATETEESKVDQGKQEVEINRIEDDILMNTSYE